MILSPRSLPRLRVPLASFLLLHALPPLIPFAAACTTIAVGRDATIDGSVLSSHSNDADGTTDPRLVLIPASDWPANSSRPVFYSPESFPRYVGTDRAAVEVPAYAPGGDDDGASFEPICSIPQVSHTYRYFEETYGAMNERQLGISESTCSGVFGAAPKGMDFPDYGVGKACFSIDSLSQIAMERHSRARDAIAEMGALAVEHGFYGAGLFEGTSESLIVTDVDEAWVFHVLPDPTGASAIWAAQRVPDDSFAVVANAFIIRDIDPDDSDNFMYSESVYDVAESMGWWDPADSEPLDFTAQYSDGEYSHKYYSGRRSWGVYKLLAPSLGLKPDYVEWRISDPYPFAARPDSRLGLDDVARAMRSFYEGTEYSQAGPTSGLNLAGGPWNTPDHVAGGAADGDDDRFGSWERTIGLYRTSDSYVTQSRGWLPDSVGGTLWFGPYAAPYSTYVPFAVGMTSLPDVTLGYHMELNKETMFWANRYLGNYVQLKWTDMIEEVRDFQRKMMEESQRLQTFVDGMVLGGLDYDGDDDGHDRNDNDNNDGQNQDALGQLLGLYYQNAIRTVRRTWDLCDHLMFKYADGEVHNTATSLGTSTAPREYDSRGATTKDADVVTKPGYPNDWLERVGYYDGPPPPPDCEKLMWKCGHKPPQGKGGEEEGGVPSSSRLGGGGGARGALTSTE